MVDESVHGCLPWGLQNVSAAKRPHFNFCVPLAHHQGRTPLEAAACQMATKRKVRWLVVVVMSVCTACSPLPQCESRSFCLLG